MGSLPPPSVSITATRLVIYGSIVNDLEMIVKTMPPSIRLVVLDSPGGMSDPADRIAKEFRRRGARRMSRTAVVASVRVLSCSPERSTASSTRPPR